MQSRIKEYIVFGIAAAAVLVAFLFAFNGVSAEDKNEEKPARSVPAEASAEIGDEDLSETELISPEELEALLASSYFAAKTEAPAANIPAGIPARCPAR